MALHAASVHSKVSTILLMVVPYLRFVIFLAANFNKNFDLQDYNEKKLDITFELPYPTPTLQTNKGKPTAWTSPFWFTLNFGSELTHIPWRLIFYGCANNAARSAFHIVNYINTNIAVFGVTVKFISFRP